MLEWFGDLRSRDSERRARLSGSIFGESPGVVRRLLGSGVSMRALVVSDRRAGFLDSLSGRDGRIEVVEESKLFEAVGFEMHRGVIGLFERPPEIGLKALDGLAHLLIIEGVNDADNVGSLIRTAAAFGVDAVVCDPRTADVFSRRAVRVSMGTVGMVGVCRPTTWPPPFENRTVVALTPQGEIELSQLGDHRRVGVAVGAEGPGLSDALLAAADIRARIQMAKGVDSLNVSHAAAIALHRFSSVSPPTP